MVLFSFECLFIEKNVFYYFKEIQAMAKKLLKEAVVRRFQSLANISPINEMYSYNETEEEKEEEMKEGMYEAEEEVAGEDMDAEMAPVEMDAGEEEMAGEDAMSMDDVELTDEEAQALIAFGDKESAAMGDAAEDVARDDENGMPPMDDAPMDAPEDEEAEMMEALSGVHLAPSTQNEIVNEVARRVARRLAEAQKAQKKMNEALGRK